MRYQTLLFDLDHTLFDTDACEALAFDATLRGIGLDDPSIHYDSYRRINNELWAAVERSEVAPIEVRSLRFQRLIAEAALDAEVEAMAAAFVDGLANQGELFPGAREALDELSQVATLALITNGLSDVQRSRLARLDLAAHFDAIIISEEVGATKPGTAIFDAAFEQLGQPPRASSVIIGDSLTSDIKGGTNYGIATCWYNPHGRTAGPDDVVTHEISELAEIADLVR